MESFRYGFLKIRVVRLFVSSIALISVNSLWTMMGTMYYEWTKIHQQIGNRKYSNIIRHYSTYLDVIYGNRQNLPQELHDISS